MSEKQNHFKPDTIDTQLDELTQLAQLPGADPEVRTVQALQQIYKNQVVQEAASIDRVFNRFIHQATNKDKPANDQQENSISTQTTALLEFSPFDVSVKAGKIQGSRSSMQKQHYSTARRIGVAIAAVLALALIAGSVISFLLIANTRVATSPKKIVTNATAQPKPTIVHTVAPTVTPIPQPQTTCPDAGTSRAAILPPLTQKVGQSIVYVATEANDYDGLYHMIKSYDVTSGQTTSLLSLDTSNVDNAQYITESHLSSNGQWIALVVTTSNNTLHSVSQEIQLLRIDGQYRQTLYCAPNNTYISDISLSPDMKSIIFGLSLNSPQRRDGNTPLNETGVYQLDMINGGMAKTLLSTPEARSDFVYVLAKWLNNSHMTIRVVDNDINEIVILDVLKGENQQIAQLPVLLTNQHLGWDTSPDGSLVVSMVSQSATDTRSNGSLLVQNIMSGDQQTIVNREDLPIESVEVISNQAILFTVHNAPDAANNGLWRISTDGTNLVQLIKDSNTINVFPITRNYSIYTSDDGSIYVIAQYQLPDPAPQPTILSYMLTQGGNLVTFSNNLNSYVLGWTTY